MRLCWPMGRLAPGPLAQGLRAAPQGLPTIRAFRAQGRFRAQFTAALDANGAWWFAFISTARWVGFRLDLIASVILTAGCILAMAIYTKVRSCQPRMRPDALKLLQSLPNIVLSLYLGFLGFKISFSTLSLPT